MKKDHKWQIYVWIIGIITVAAGLVCGYRLWCNMAFDVDIITVNTTAPYEEGCEVDDSVPEELEHLEVDQMDEADQQVYLPFVEALQRQGFESFDFRGTKARKDGKDYGIMTYFVMVKQDKKIQFHIQNTYVPSCGTIHLSQSLPSMIQGDEVYLFQKGEQMQAFAIKNDLQYALYFNYVDIKEAVFIMKLVLNQP